MKNVVQAFKLSAMLALLFTAAAVQADEWKAPASADARKNPVPMDAKSIAAGKKVWMKECAECHGNTGKGDGEKAKELTKDPGNLSDPKRIGPQSDGALQWKITVGKSPMPPYLKLPEEQRWQLVNYMRSISSDKGAAADAKPATGDAKTTGAQ